MGAACWGANGRRSVAAWHSTRPRQTLFPVCSLVCLAWCAVSVCPVRWVKTPRLPQPPHSRRTAYLIIRCNSAVALDAPEAASARRSVEPLSLSAGLQSRRLLLEYISEPLAAANRFAAGQRT